MSLVLESSASLRAAFAVFWALVISPASCWAPVRLGLKSCWLAADLLKACSRLVSGVGAVNTLLMSGGSLVRVSGAVKPAAIEGAVVGSVTGPIAGAASAGASAQF